MLQQLFDIYIMKNTTNDGKYCDFREYLILAQAQYYNHGMLFAKCLHWILVYISKASKGSEFPFTWSMSAGCQGNQGDCQQEAAGLDPSGSERPTWWNLSNLMNPFSPSAAVLLICWGPIS